MKILWKNLNLTWIIYFFLVFQNVKTTALPTPEGIIGGFLATPDQFRHQVSIQIQRVHVCGGSIISFFHVLTAGHCFFDNKFEFNTRLEYSIVYGTNDLTFKTTPGFRVLVELIYVLADYKPLSQQNKHFRKSDLSIVKLSKILNEQIVKVLQLASGDTAQLYGNKMPVIAGFGCERISVEIFAKGKTLREVPTKSSLKLKYTETSILPNNICVSRYGSQVTDANVFCAQMKQLNKYAVEGICTGDSGGGLVVDGNIIIGVAVASPLGCDEQFRPGLYGNITSSVPFILDILEGNESPKFITLKPKSGVQKIKVTPKA